jgi:hypothetical protein
LAPLPGAPRPADSHEKRLREIRTLARRFAVELIDGQGQKRQLRVLTRPIFTYESPAPAESLGGAIVAFCIETDPECLLFLEARPVDGVTQWMYAPVATSIDRLFLKLDDVQVWSADPPVFKTDSPHWKGFIREARIPLTIGDPDTTTPQP